MVVLGGVTLVAEGVLELAITVGSGSGVGFAASGVLFISSGETDPAVAIALGYKSPIVV